MIGGLPLAERVRQEALRATRRDAAGETAYPFPEGKLSRERPQRGV